MPTAPVSEPTDCPLGPDDLQAHVLRERIHARLVRDLGETRTVPLAASALGVEPGRIIKSLLFLVRTPGKPDDPEPVLVLAAGNARVDYRAIAEHFGVSRKRVRLASAEVVLSTTGYPAGGVPPFGHRARIPAILDAALLAPEYAPGAPVYAGGGDERTMLETTVAELLRVLHPELLAVSGAQRSCARGKQRLGS